MLRISCYVHIRLVVIHVFYVLYIRMYVLHCVLKSLSFCGWWIYALFIA
jgi:hypothetical protein